MRSRRSSGKRQERWQKPTRYSRSRCTKYCHRMTRGKADGCQAVYGKTLCGGEHGRLAGSNHDRSAGPCGYLPLGLAVPWGPLVRLAYPTEADEQAAVIQWWSLKCKAWKVPPHLLYHIANEGSGSVARGRLLKRTGVRAGCPDLCLSVARGGFFGLFVEMKRKAGRLTPEQKAFHEDLREQGYRVETCYGADQAIDTITNYMLS